MNPKPPRLAFWLMERWTLGYQKDSQIGDVLEQYQRGRSATWLWRQTISVIVVSAAAELWRHKWLAAAVVGVSIYLPEIYMRVFPPRWSARLDRLWYPRVLNSHFSWLVLNPWPYRLELRALTSRLTFCILLAMVTWIARRANPRARRLIVTLLMVTQVGECIPSLWIALENWLQDPANPMWFFILFWFSSFVLVGIPGSIWLGSSWGARDTQMPGRPVLLDRRSD